MAPSGDADPSSNSRKGGGTYPKPARLLRHEDFQKVYQQGRRHFSPHMTVFYLPRAEGKGCRVGLTVGKVLGGAVDRNRIKRRVREAVRLQRSGVPVQADVVINPKKSVLKVEFTVLLNEVGRAFEVIQQKLKEKSPAKRKP